MTDYAPGPAEFFRYVFQRFDEVLPGDLSALAFEFNDDGAALIEQAIDRRAYVLGFDGFELWKVGNCLLYTSPSPRD